NDQAQRRGRCEANVRLAEFTTEKRKKLFAPSACSEWLAGPLSITQLVVPVAYCHHCAQWQRETH
ncbi:unnamed protein product, partial [marine sediment metagenome]